MLSAVMTLMRMFIVDSSCHSSLNAYGMRMMLKSRPNRLTVSSRISPAGPVPNSIGPSTMGERKTLRDSL